MFRIYSSSKHVIHNWLKFLILPSRQISIENVVKSCQNKQIFSLEVLLV